MPFLLKLLASIWIATLAVTAGFAYVEVREDRGRLVQDLQRRAALVADAVRGAAAVLLDAHYVDEGEWSLWRRAAVRLGILSLILTGITWMMVRWSVTRPMARMAQWTKQLKSGRGVALPPDADPSLFGPLAQE